MKDFRGWATVFEFTFRQSTKKAFKIITALVAVLIIGSIIIINIFAARPKKDNYYEENMNQPELSQGVSAVKKVVILDNSGLEPTDYNALNPPNGYYNPVEFVYADVQTRDELLDYAANDSDRTIAVMISAKDGTFEMEAIIPYNSIIPSMEVEQLIEQMTSSFEANKIMQTNLSDEELAAVFTPIITSYSEFGESSNMAAMVIKMIAPMILSFFMYFMFLFYGQIASKSVSSEKTSKLMETLLTSVHPYAMITGKILAVTSIAILQFSIWVMSAIVGLYAGNAIAHQIFPGYESSVVSFINFIKDNIGETGMTIPAAILAVLTFIIGFIFYCVIAALAGCLVSKPDDVASTQGLFQFPVVISWLICYFAPISGNDKLLSIVRYIPFTAPFCVPSDILTGTIGYGEGILTLLILTAFSLLIIILASRIYKGLVLYTGQKPNMKLIINILKG
ncbi:MAG TPA: ABC transporter permease [Clostridiales bacterium]|jgi:ABC-type Na+ efflux pump permease subunit|nr:ABC transporter permease [Clostridiales bacterium]